MVTAGIGWVVMADEVVTTGTGLVVMGARVVVTMDVMIIPDDLGKVVGCGMSLVVNGVLVVASDLAV